jgi:hypothetical protein
MDATALKPGDTVRLSQRVAEGLDVGEARAVVVRADETARDHLGRAAACGVDLSGLPDDLLGRHVATVRVYPCLKYPLGIEAAGAGARWPA